MNVEQKLISSKQVQGTSFDAVQKIWSGKQTSPLFHESMSIGQIALFVLGINPHKVIQVCETTGEQLTCQNLTQLGIRIAQNLKYNLGLQQEDIIGIMANNTTYLAPVVLGAFLIGAPVNPIHHASDRNTVKHLFGLTKPKVVFCDGDVYTTLIQGLDDIGWSCKIYTLSHHIDGVASVEELLQAITSEDDFSPAIFTKGGDQTAAILCSSGTTGLPKGVCVSHRTLLSRNVFWFLGSDDVLFTFSTLHWISGVWTLVQSLILGAIRVITDQPFSSELFLEIIEKHKVTLLIGPPSHAALSIQCPDIALRDLSSVRNYICGGSSVPVSVSRKIKKHLGKNSFSETYGLTELGALSNLNRWPHQKEGSVGQLNPNTKARILSENGEPLGIGETGEIHLWSPNKWSGYYGNPEMTRLVLHDDGWIKTGDLGYFDEEGYLFVCGRLKEILKYRNYQISPSEIEELIIKIPGVVEVCVFGIPDELSGDLPAAGIVKSPNSTLTEDDVCKTVASCLTETKHLHGGVYFVPELPKTVSGKIQRHQLLSMVTQMTKK